MKILMSGISSVTAAGTIIFLAAFVINSRLYSISGSWLRAVRDRCWVTLREPRALLPFSKTPGDRRCAYTTIIPITALAISLFFLEVTRPAVPYDHLSRAVPLNMLDALHRPSMENCPPPPLPFPFHGKGGPHHHHHGPPPPPPGPFGFPPPPPPPPPHHFPVRPSWLPDEAPPGFQRWNISDTRDDQEFGIQPQCPGVPFQHYNAERDPMKVSNTGEEVIETLKQAFKENSVEIHHVVLVTLESGRKELFPMQAGTPLYGYIVESHPEKDRKAAIDTLSQMTPVAQMLTGEYALDSAGQTNDFSGEPWANSSVPGMGGINVKGALTPSTLTLKSILGSHCGVSPLPVDLLEEVNHEFYQPCLPQIFELFNRKKGGGGKNSEKPFLGLPWKSAYIQPGTDSYDRQHKLNELMGFEEIMSKESLQDPASKHFPPKTSETNYFGYAEGETKPYIQDLINDAAEGKNRLFLSHLTTSTHHPWSLPKNFVKKQYMGSEGSVDHKSMNDYLNTIRFVDDWLGEMLGLLDEAGISNNTLVVMVGDHGQAFSEDSKTTGTFENGHISNFHVPLLFRNPNLPHIDVSANATSLSIIPTILDLLVQSESLDEQDSVVASALVPEFQGQSLIRPFRNEREEDGQPLWNMALINGGGSILGITSANSPYRLILPLKEEFNFRFTNLEKDPGETRPIQAWTVNHLVSLVTKDHGREAAAWLEEAEQVGTWWVAEQKRLWDYRKE
ncbi:hypothetical protein AWENTII_004257 [Aspergillus wentii]